MTPLILSAGRLRLTVVPALGAGLADFSIQGPSGVFYPLLRRAAPAETNPSLLGSFFMAPWANRLRGAAFTFRGRSVALRPTTADGMAQHGDVRKRPWQVHTSSPTAATLAYDSRSVTDSNWPWAYSCTAAFALDDAGLTLDLSVKNEDREPFPAGCGHHPYFARRLWNDADVLHIKAPVAARYPLEAGCATGAPAPERLTHHLADLRPVPDEHIDAVFSGFARSAELRWPSSAVTLRIEASANMSHLVLFTPHAQPSGPSSPLPFVAVEPQTHTNDALNLEAKTNTPGAFGTVVLEPGQSLSTRCRVSVLVG